MEAKKSKKAAIENQRGSWLLIFMTVKEAQKQYDYTI